MTITNQPVQIPVSDGTTMQAYLAQPSTDHAPAGVIVAHELFGVNPDIRGVADDLAANGYLTIAPEFYHRDAPPGHWLERDDSGRQDGFAYLNRLTRPQALDDTAACVSWLKSQPRDRADRDDRLQRRRPSELPRGLPAPDQPDGGPVRRLAAHDRYPDEPALTDAGPHRRDRRPDPLPGRRRRHPDRRGPAPSRSAVSCKPPVPTTNSSPTPAPHTRSSGRAPRPSTRRHAMTRGPGSWPCSRPNTARLSRGHPPVCVRTCRATCATFLLSVSMHRSAKSAASSSPASRMASAAVAASCRRDAVGAGPGITGPRPSPRRNTRSVSRFGVARSLHRVRFVSGTLPA